ncbi:MAG: Na+/H+ antiporter subunit E [Nitrospiria bacterium]
MYYYILHNIVLAFIWCLLQEKFDFPEFLLGALFGYAILYLLREVLDDKKDERRILQHRDYFHLTAKTARYIVIFLKELIKANIEVVKIVLSPNLNITPGIIAYKLDVKTDAGITLLANSITLTPGTLSVDISDDRKTLYIHALHMDNVREQEASIRDSLEKYSKEILG